MRSVLFRIPLPFGLSPLEIASYGSMLAIGAMLGIYLGTVRANKVGERPERILDLALWVIIAGIIGARAFYILFEMPFSEIADNPFVILAFHKGGLVFYGALVFAIPVGILYLRWKKLNLWKFADIVAPSIALGIAFTRIGCFLNSCCFGLPASSGFPIGVIFPEGSIPVLHYGAQLALYPSQLISSLNALILFVILSILFSRRRFDGHIFWSFVGLYAITRFAIEFLRGDNPRFVFHTFTLSQTLGLIFLPLSVYMLFHLRRVAGSRSTLQKG